MENWVLRKADVPDNAVYVIIALLSNANTIDVAAVTSVDGPTLLYAATVNVYAEPLARPVTLYDVSVGIMSFMVLSVGVAVFQYVILYPARSPVVGEFVTAVVAVQLIKVEVDVVGPIRTFVGGV